eukprot:15477819-Alexandrium_andersonii.AAC.1
MSLLHIYRSGVVFLRAALPCVLLHLGSRIVCPTGHIKVPLRPAAATARWYRASSCALASRLCFLPCTVARASV